MVGWGVLGGLAAAEWERVGGDFVLTGERPLLDQPRARLPSGTYGLAGDQRWRWRSRGAPDDAPVDSFGAGLDGTCGLIVGGEVQRLPGCEQVVGPVVVRGEGTTWAVYERGPDAGRGNEIVVRRLSDGREVVMSRPRRNGMLEPFVAARADGETLQLRYGRMLAVLEGLESWPGGVAQRLEARRLQPSALAGWAAVLGLALLLCGFGWRRLRRLRRVVASGLVRERSVAGAWVTEWLRVAQAGEGAYREGETRGVRRSVPGRLRDVTLRAHLACALVWFCAGSVAAASFAALVRPM